MHHLLWDFYFSFHLVGSYLFFHILSNNVSFHRLWLMQTWSSRTQLKGHLSSKCNTEAWGNWLPLNKAFGRHCILNIVQTHPRCAFFAFAFTSPETRSDRYPLTLPHALLKKYKMQSIQSWKWHFLKIWVSYQQKSRVCFKCYVTAMSQHYVCATILSSPDIVNLHT